MVLVGAIQRHVKRKCQMAKTVEVKAEKKVIISDLNAAIAEMENGSDIRAAIDKELLKASVAEVKVEAGKFSGDYVKLELGDKAETEAQLIEAMRLIAGGNLTSPTDDEGDADDSKPSVVKWFLYGADLAARSRTSQRIKAAAQGPEKAIEKMADLIVKNKPGTSRAEAIEQATALLS